MILGQILTTAAAILIIYVYTLPLILIHELGHLLAGYLSGFVLVQLRVGLAELARPSGYQLEEPLRLGWRWTLADFCSGHIVMCSRQPTVVGARRRFSAYLLGGPLANLVSALLVLPIAWQDTTAAGFAKYFVAAYVFLGGGNLIPFSRHGLESDGGQLWSILFDRKWREARLCDFTLGARLREFRSLCVAGKLEEAADCADQLIRDDERMSKVPGSEEFRQRLSAHRDRLRSALSPQKAGGAEVPESAENPVE